MVLDFPNALFKNTGLQQDTGKLAERWGQDGSVIKNLNASADVDTTVYTVTAGKRLFINSIQTTANGEGRLRDGGGAGTIKLVYNGDGTTAVSFALPTPIYFDTSVYLDDSGATTGLITLEGWEEDAP